MAGWELWTMHATMLLAPAVVNGVSSVLSLGAAAETMIIAHNTAIRHMTKKVMICRASTVIPDSTENVIHVLATTFVD